MGKMYQPLFDYLHNELGVLALECQMHDILDICKIINAAPCGRSSAQGIVETILDSRKQVNINTPKIGERTNP